MKVHVKFQSFSHCLYCISAVDGEVVSKFPDITKQIAIFVNFSYPSKLDQCAVLLSLRNNKLFMC